MYVNGVQVPSGGLSLNKSHEKSTTLAYQTLFNGSGIHHSNSGLQMTHDLFVNGYFMLVFDLTPEGSASDGHVNLPENGNLRIELKFDSALTDAITCLLYLEYDGSVQIDKLRNVTTDFERENIGYPSNNTCFEKLTFFSRSVPIGCSAAFDLIIRDHNNQR
jgi:hypothetical protein